MIVDDGRTVHEVRDCDGRRYRTGEDPRDLLGRPRGSVLAASAVAMAAVGVMQYGFGAVAPALMAARGWGLEGTFWLLAGWIVFQAGAGFPVATLHGRRAVRPRSLMVAAALLCGLGLVGLGAGGPLGAVAYTVLGGSGAGIVYATCSSVVAAWYPERAPQRVSLVTGAFALGSLPVVVAALVALDPGALTPALVGAGLVVLVVVAAAGVLLADPPPHWWPADVDPRRWALRRGPSRLQNPASGRSYTPRQALRTRALLLVAVVLAAAVAVSLLDAAFLVVLALGLGAGPGPVVLAAALLVGFAGGGRSVAVTVGDRVGAVRTISAVLLVQAVAQAVLAMAAASGSVGLVVAGGALAGAGGGAFYPLFAGLTREFFGRDSAVEVHAVVYSAKAVGGVLGVGLAATVVTQWGFAAAFGLAVAVSAAAALGARAFTRPGLPRTLPGPVARVVAGAPGQRAFSNSSASGASTPSSSAAAR
ncbi:MFS transporter [Actinomycetospora sp. NBRC 106375]|uniref:MFS transporter n=1 Tax=Actinomycetospora sp. NBRC 106375 TaxID=3032207 RepID=UPI0024A2928F|nr:MFS transporter [Actinomycetospora sp. NBRC 106375]GLZ47479.1 MFS transporter [Actinomycetospora sp. NBRC 106375]